MPQRSPSLARSGEAHHRHRLTKGGELLPLLLCALHQLCKAILDLLHQCVPIPCALPWVHWPSAGDVDAIASHSVTVLETI
jgi:hypothetical protein